MNEKINPGPTRHIASPNEFEEPRVETYYKKLNSKL